MYKYNPFTETLDLAGAGSNPVLPNYVVIKQFSDFPDPVGGVISLLPNTTYLLQNIIDIGTNTLNLGSSSTILGFDKSDDGILYTGTGAAFTTVNKTVSIVNIIIIAPNGSCVDVTNSVTYSFQLRECIIGGGNVGTVAGGNLIVFNNNVTSAVSGNGLKTTGVCIKVAIAFNFFESSSAEWHMNIESGTYDVIKITDNDFACGLNTIGVNVAEFVNINNNGGGSVISNGFSGTGTYIAGVEDDTLDWIIEANGSKILSTSGRRFIRKIRNEQQLFNFLAEPNPSDYVYEIDGVINVTQSIVVPNEGLTFKGYGNNFSTITTNVDNLDIFIGGGNAFFNDLRLSNTGIGSKIFNMTSATGFEAVEFVNVNFENCEDIGILNGFRQGLLLNGFILNVKQGLLFRGTWAGGFRLDASRFIFTVPGSTYMFKSDVGHTFGSRFFSNANTTVGAGAIGYDFTESNFVEDATFQMIESENTGSGVYVNPAINGSSIKSLWRDNIGLDDTFQGVVVNNATTTITTIAATQVYTELQCDAQLIESAWLSLVNATTFSCNYDSTLPINIAIELFLSLSSGNNNEIELQIRNYRASLVGGFDNLGSFKLTTNGGALGTRVESTSLKTFDRVNKDDKIRIFVRNNSGTTSVSLDNSSKFIITKR